MTFKVLIEIPKGTVNKKWEFDHKSKTMVLDFVFKDLVWPFNYGEVVNTLGGDGDALDAMVFSAEPIKQSAIVDCVPFGIVKMLDRGEVDDKLCMVPVGDLLMKKYKDISDFSHEDRQLVKDTYAEIARQKNKVVKILGFENKEKALEGIKQALI